MHELPAEMAENAINGRALIPFLEEDNIVEPGGKYEDGLGYTIKIHVNDRLM
ncbi:hypothetical protein EXIGLDRAFT_774560 [Exidia glandulosa HHB12029]|uniref:Uncharacterized protein n=1 Tax=Exidia glandulosa HHB12029 TaxID=1314781 RepID=A0A165EBA5_EXIGL|nr:hypothetical protein EXIGLDRAFT_774560 [Exidia glandulosa HHB12029]